MLVPSHLEGTSALISFPESNLHVGDVLGAVEREGDLALASVGHDFLGARPPRLRVFLGKAIVGEIGKAAPFSAADVPRTLSWAVVVGAGRYADCGLGPGLDEAGVVISICRRGSRFGGGRAGGDGGRGRLLRWGGTRRRHSGLGRRGARRRGGGRDRGRPGGRGYLDRLGGRRCRGCGRLRAGQDNTRQAR